MNLNIAVSKAMDAQKDQLYENRIVRISQMGREFYGVQLDDRVTLRALDGKVIVLRVAEALKADLSDEYTFVSVTSKIGKMLGLKDYGNVVWKVEGITLGCDPELFLINEQTGNVINASRYFRRMDQVGFDGMLLEFRPNPHLTEDGVTLNLYNLIKTTRATLNRHTEGRQVGILAASCYRGMSAGFHLHYGLPKALTSFNSQAKNLARIMTVAFDYYIGIPSIIPEGNADYSRRTHPNYLYGKPGGFRVNGKTFEYRLPGGILMAHPLLARGILALGAVVVEDLVSRINTYTDRFMSLNLVQRPEDIRLLYPNSIDITELFKMICNPSIEPAKAYLPSIVEDVRQMVGYGQRANAVEAFFRCLHEGTVFDKNVELNWGGFENAVQQGQVGFLQTAQPAGAHS